MTRIEVDASDQEGSLASNRAYLGADPARCSLSVKFGHRGVFEEGCCLLLMGFRHHEHLGRIKFLATRQPVGR